VGGASDGLFPNPGSRSLSEVLPKSKFSTGLRANWSWSIPHPTAEPISTRQCRTAGRSSPTTCRRKFAVSMTYRSRITVHGTITIRSATGSRRWSRRSSPEFTSSFRQNPKYLQVCKRKIAGSFVLKAFQVTLEAKVSQLSCSAHFRKTCSLPEGIIIVRIRSGLS
jgi:hypothetical protein